MLSLIKRRSGMKTFKKSATLIVLSLLLTLGAGTAFGAYPERPITLVLHSGAGGGTDVMGRFIAAIFQKHKLLPQPLVVENRGGGGGAIAMSYVNGKKGDPYFLMSATSGYLLNNLTGRSPLSYRDFTPIARISLDEHMLMIPANSQFKDIHEVVAFAKKNPGVVTVAMASMGNVESLNMYYFQQATGARFSAVAFGSGGKALTALLGGHVSMGSGSPGDVIELVAANKVRVLGLLAAKRFPGVDYPTLREQGIDAVGLGMYRGIVAPKGISEEARKVLDEAFTKFSKLPEFKKFNTDMLAIPAYQNSADFGKYLAVQSDRCENALKEIGILKKWKKKK